MIEEISAWTIPYTEPNDHGSTRYVSICRVLDTSGVAGWGEAVTISHEAAQATTEFIRSIAPHLRGVTAQPAALNIAMQKRGWWYSHGGGVSGFARAALDTAIWDLLARSLDAPLTQVLGGVAHPAGLPTIVTTHAMLADIDEQCAQFAFWVDEFGAAGVKVGFGKPGDANLGFDEDRDVQFVGALRKALGNKAKIMIDVSPLVRWSTPEAIQRVKKFAEHGVHWIEEPLGAHNPGGYERLASATDVLIAYGEREWDFAGMARILDSGTLDVLGIDTGRAGGITDFLAAAKYAEAKQRQVNAHAFAGPISYAAGLACSLVSPNALQFEVAPLRNSLVANITPDLPLPHEGRVAALPGPGLGIEIDADLISALAES